MYVLSYNLHFLTQHFLMGSHYLSMYMYIYPIYIFSAISFHNFFFAMQNLKLYKNYNSIRHYPMDRDSEFTD